MKRMASLLTLLFFLSSLLVTAARAQDFASMMAGVKLDKGQVKSMIDMMESSGQISAEDAKKARAELDGMSDSDMNKLKDKALERMAGGKMPTLPAPKQEQEKGRSSASKASALMKTSEVSHPQESLREEVSEKDQEEASKEEELQKALQLLQH